MSVTHTYHNEKMLKYRLLKEVASQMDEEIESYKATILKLKSHILSLTEKVHNLNTRLAMSGSIYVEEVDLFQ